MKQGDKFWVDSSVDSCAIMTRGNLVKAEDNVTSWLSEPL